MTEESRVAGQALRDLKIPRGSIVGSIQRHEKVSIPDGTTLILPGDHVVIFALPDAVSAVEKLFSKKRS